MAAAEPPTPQPPFSEQVQRCFEQQAPAYEDGARLQAAVAQRLARCGLPLLHQLPQGPRADLGAGSGLLSRAIETQLAPPPLLRLDNCPALLAQERQRDGAVPQQHWDLNQGLPPELQGAALLASSFALQWLETPAAQLQHWGESLQPGGVLLLAVPCAGSFCLWREAAAAAAVPCSALAMPAADGLIAAASGPLQLQQAARLRFSRRNPGALAFLRQIKAIGAQASQQPPLNAAQMRRLLRHWPGPEQAIVWEVLLLVGRRR